MNSVQYEIRWTASDAVHWLSIGCPLAVHCKGPVFEGYRDSPLESILWWPVIGLRYLQVKSFNLKLQLLKPACFFKPSESGPVFCRFEKMFLQSSQRNGMRFDTFGHSSVHHCHCSSAIVCQWFAKQIYDNLDSRCAGLSEWPPVWRSKRFFSLFLCSVRRMTLSGMQRFEIQANLGT